MNIGPELNNQFEGTGMNHQQQSSTTRVLSEREAATYIGMSRSFLAQSRMDGPRRNRTPAPPFVKIGRAVRYLRDDLDRWLDSFRRLDRVGGGS